jgi:hypothetical protein
MPQDADYWNHNVRYQPVIVAAVPAEFGAALDVGCGDGMRPAPIPSLPSDMWHLSGREPTEPRPQREDNFYWVAFARYAWPKATQ